MRGITPGEKVEELADGTIRYRVTLSSLAEVAGWVLTFGGKCRVVEPRELRKAVEETAKEVLAQAARPTRRAPTGPRPE